MVGNKILTKDDKKELANFLFQCLSDGVSKKRINNLAQIWIEKGENDNVIKNSNYSDPFGFMASVNGILLTIIATPLIIHLAKKYNIDGGLVMVFFFISIPVFNAIIATLECGIYWMYKHISDKKYANACAEEMVDAYNVKCFKEVQMRCQKWESTVQNFTNKILDNQASNNSLYPSLDLSNIQLAQHSLTAPLENTI